MLRLVLLRLCESYFRHRWTYLLPCILMALAAYFYVAQLPATYIARGTIYAQDKTLLSSLTALGNDGYTWVTPARATVGELYELLNTKAFLRAIIENTDLEVKVSEGSNAVDATLAEARNAIWTETLGNNLVLIGAAHEMPRVAHQLVTSTIETYIQWKTNLSRNDSVTAQNFFADLIKTYQAEVDPARTQVQAFLAAHPRPLRDERPEDEVAELTRLQTAVSRAEERLNHARNQEESARLARVQTESDVRQSYSMVDAPVRPLHPERSTKEMLLSGIMFLIVGLALTSAGIVGGALLDQSFRFPIDVTNTLSLPVLAVVQEVQIELVDTVYTPADQGAQSDDAPRDTEGSTHNGNHRHGVPLFNGKNNRRRVFT